MYHINEYYKRYTELKAEQVFRYVSDLDILDSSKNTILCQFRAFAKKQGIILPLKNKRCKTAQKVPPKEGEICRIRPSMFKNKLDYFLFMLMYETGIRISELCSIKTNELNDVIKITGKGQKQRIIVLSQSTLNGLKRECKNQYICPYGYDMARYIITKYMKQFHEQGIISGNALSPHGLRHAFATHLNQNGASILAIQMALGHSSIATTEKYTHIDLEHLKSVHGRVFK